MDYVEFLEHAKKIVRGRQHVAPFHRDGTPLVDIQPNCVLYIACGEEGLVSVDENMQVQDFK